MHTISLPKYAELTPENRGSPCEEYPGEWLICIPDSLGGHWSRYWMSEERSHLGHSYKHYSAAVVAAKGFIDFLEMHKVEYNPTKISICWKANDYDPRIGEVWFTPFYMHGKFNFFGDYRET